MTSRVLSFMAISQEDRTSEPRLSFVADLPQQVPAPLAVGLLLDAEGRVAVDHAQDAAPLFALGDDHLEGVGGGTIDPAHLGAVLHPVEDADGVGAPDEEHERVARAEGHGGGARRPYHAL